MTRTTAKTLAATGLSLGLVVGICSVSQAGDVPKLNDRELDCIMEAHVTVKLSASVAGLISRVLVDRGDIVRAGDVVAELESDVEKATVDLARTRSQNDAQVRGNLARMEFLRRKLGRQERLRSSNVVTDAAVDEVDTDSRMAEANAQDAEYNVDIAKQELKRAQATLQQRTVKSPVNGVVVERLLSAGEYRNEQSNILTIAQIAPLNVEVFVPIAYHGQIDVGAKAEVRPESPVGGRYTATVKVVDRVLDAASGTFGVRLELPNADYALPAGLRCKVVFQPKLVADAQASK